MAIKYPSYLHPHVQTIIVDESIVDEIVNIPDPAVFVAPTLTGIQVIGSDFGKDNKFLYCNSSQAKQNRFGVGSFKYGQASAQLDATFAGGNFGAWVMRVLPDNARYSNLLYVLKYRRWTNPDTGLDELGLKFVTKSCIKAPASYPTTKTPIDFNYINVDQIQDIFDIETEAGSAPDAEGFNSIPFAFIWSEGHGKYGNKFAGKFTRSTGNEKQNKAVSYTFDKLFFSETGNIIYPSIGGILTEMEGATAITLQDASDNVGEGIRYIEIKSNYDYIDTIYNLYQEIVDSNRNLIETNPTYAEYEPLLGKVPSMLKFDPISCKVYDETNEVTYDIPFVKNYTLIGEPYYVDFTFANAYPTTLTQYPQLFLHATAAVVNDPNYGNKRTRAEVIEITPEGAVTWSTPEIEPEDIILYTGENIASYKMLYGGFDGDFEALYNETTNEWDPVKPNTDLFTALLSREYVKGFNGTNDPLILSPASTPADTIFDANYAFALGSDINMGTAPYNIYSDNGEPIFSSLNGELVYADAPYASLNFTTDNVNVKKAMIALMYTRNIKKSSFPTDAGAGTHLYLDLGTSVGKDIVNQDDIREALTAITNAINEIEKSSEPIDFNPSVDLGSYIIKDSTGKSRRVTTSWALSTNLPTFLTANGINATYARNNSIGYFKDFYPYIDFLDNEIQEDLYKYRVNYWIGRRVPGTQVPTSAIPAGLTANDYVPVTMRGTQSTFQTQTSKMLEENNSRVLSYLLNVLWEDQQSLIYTQDESILQSFAERENDIWQKRTDYFREFNLYWYSTEIDETLSLRRLFVDIWFRDMTKRITTTVTIRRNSMTSAEAYDASVASLQ